MNIDWSEWGPPLAVLAGGLALGGALLGRARRGGDPAVTAEGQREDLAQSRATALEALRALELEKDRLDPQAYQTERAALLARGANAMRQLEEGEAVPVAVPVAVAVPGAAPAGDLAGILASERARVGPAAFAAAVRQVAPELRPPPPPAIAPEWKGAGYTAAVCGLAAVLFTMAQDDSVDRAAGGTMTGNTQQAGAQQMPPEWQQAVDAEEAKLATNANDVDALNNLTQLQLSAGDAAKAMEYNKRVIGIDATNADARTYRGVLAATVGMYDKALAEFDSVLADHPDHVRALTYRGLVLLEMQRGAEAVTALEAALKAQPGNPTLMRALGRAREMAGGPPMQGGPMQGGPMGAPPSGPPETILTGTVTLDPAKAAQLKGTETLYVVVADPAQPRPPLAAVKLASGPFPQQIDVTTANVISMGGPRPVPDVVNVTVRIDVDGNPMTQDNLATWTGEGTKKGATGLQIQLQ